MNLHSKEDNEEIEWIDSEDGIGERDLAVSEISENSGPKFLIRQDSIHDLAAVKTLIRQNSLHDSDKKFTGFSSERSLSWDNYVDNYSNGKDSDEILEGLKEIREQLKESDDGNESSSGGEEVRIRGRRSLGRSSKWCLNCGKNSENLSVDSHQNFKRNLSNTSSKNTRFSGDVSDFSFESHNWNSKQSLSLETYQSHQRQRDAFDSSSGITSISEDEIKKTSDESSNSRGRRRRRRLGPHAPLDSSEDLYEYDDEIDMSMTSKLPSIDEDLMARGKKPHRRNQKKFRRERGFFFLGLILRDFNWIFQRFLLHLLSLSFFRNFFFF